MKYNFRSKEKFNTLDGKGKGTNYFGDKPKAGFKPDQERDESGKWTSGGSWHKIDADVQIKTHMDSYDAQEDQYGSTFDPMTGENLLGQKNMFSVSTHEHLSWNPGQMQPTKEMLETFLKKHKDLFSQGNLALGTWHSKSDDGLWIDVISIVEGREKAEALGAKHNQYGIYDLENGKYIPTGGTGKSNIFVMEAKGRKNNKATRELGKWKRESKKAAKNNGKKR